MSEDRNSYKGITKSIGLFGGTKVFQIMVGVVRAKLLAILIGPSGMGLLGLFQSLIDIISVVTGFGLQTSTIRDVTKAYSERNQDKINITVSIVKKLVLFTGFLGTVITLLFAKQLSLFIFDSPEYTDSIRLLSIIFIITQINIGQTILIQSTFNYKDLAKSALFGNILALIVTIPIYYRLRENGIVLSLISGALVTLLFSWFYSRRIKYTKIKTPLKQIWNEGRVMILMGISLALSGLLSRLTTFIMNVFLINASGVEMVGLYNAGYGMANSYILIILSAMTADYVPRLSVVSDDNSKIQDLVNKQSILLITLIMPLIAFMSIFAEEVVLILYSEEFLKVTTMMTLVLFGMLFRAVSWSMSYVFVAQGGGKLFIINEAITGIISLLLSYICFNLFGLTGIGISFILTYMIYTLQLYFFLNKSISFKFSHEMFKIFTFQVVIGLASLLVALFTNGWWHHAIGMGILLLSLYWSYKVLNERIGIQKIIISRIRRFRIK